MDTNSKRDLAQVWKEDGTEPQDSREPTYGERAVGVKFNPSKFPAVDDCKAIVAAFIDQMHELRSTTTDPEVKRMCSIAITDAQSAQMWAVKAITWA